MIVNHNATHKKNRELSKFIWRAEVLNRCSELLKSIFPKDRSWRRKPYEESVKKFNNKWKMFMLKKNVKGTALNKSKNRSGRKKKKESINLVLENLIENPNVSYWESHRRNGSSIGKETFCHIVELDLISLQDSCVVGMNSCNRKRI